MKIDELTFKLFLVWYFVGIILLTFDLIPPALEWANVVFLILSGLIGGIYFIKSFGINLGLSLSLIIVFFSIFAEHIGVEYGLLFGDYYYTSDFGPKLIGVPIAIGFAWLMVIAGSHAISSVITKKQQFIPYTIIASLLAVLIDLVIDPVAYEVKNYWVWNAESFYYNIPMSNFIGWFIVAFILHSVIYLLSLKAKRTITIWHSRIVTVYFLVLAMFLLLSLFNGLWLAVFITGLFSLITIFTYIRNRHHLFD
ncbi:carotenoid biosynthesis protein [Metabacillus litoralis]|uniref:Carotenoid biosynthesis protein n=1 Tax=Metabacillus litoralis TaxID=152268 RepID=A0A5C6VZI1_9BACI|nr:carotenoid biosynthesis protein [Metabacillus litoralis]TXC90795.1 carotenoid biosynthesis protein [Metabacillus litoralis]